MNLLVYLLVCEIIIFFFFSTSRSEHAKIKPRHNIFPFLAQTQVSTTPQSILLGFVRRHLNTIKLSVFDKPLSIVSLCFRYIYFHYTFLKVITDARNKCIP